MNKFNEIRLLLCGHIHKVRALYFLFIFHFSLDFPKGWAKTPKLNKPESYIVWEEREGWLNVGNSSSVPGDPLESTCRHASFYKVLRYI
uniref:Uncharacterized protein n=1 Tax=Bacillus thuringiensis serovar chinensis CT-43 TaxID=541229 RepID=E7CGG5_BACTU|nr:hypothetical protein pBMB0558_00190 [Bacillus thuringiensis serovar chinensis CT-43]